MPGVNAPNVAWPGMLSESWLATSPPTGDWTAIDVPLRATSATRLSAASAFEVNCRRAIDVVTARRGLKRTNTVHVPPLTAGAVRWRAAGASGPEVQVWLVIVKSCAEACSGFGRLRP